MKTYQVDAELSIAEKVTGTISVTFQAENIEAAVEMSRELLGDIITKDFSAEIFRVDEIVEEDGE